MDLLVGRALIVVAFLLHVGIGVLYLAAGLVAPLWAVLLLWVTWVALLYALVQLGRRNPPLALLAPVASVGLILGVITLGEQLLGWSG